MSPLQYQSTTFEARANADGAALPRIPADKIVTAATTTLPLLDTLVPDRNSDSAVGCQDSRHAFSASRVLITKDNNSLLSRFAAYVAAVADADDVSFSAILLDESLDERTYNATVGRQTGVGPQRNSPVLLNLVHHQPENGAIDDSSDFAISIGSSMQGQLGTKPSKVSQSLVQRG
jgi:hypothetical protein